MAQCSLKCNSAKESIRMCLGVISSFNWQIEDVCGCLYVMGWETQRKCVCFLNLSQSVLGNLSVIFVVLIFCIKIDKCSQLKACVLFQLQNIQNPVLRAHWKAGSFSTFRHNSCQHNAESNLNPLIDTVITLGSVDAAQLSLHKN